MDDGQPQWPEFWKKDQLEAVKASLPVANGMHSGNNNHIRRNFVLLSENGGNVGTNRNLPCNISFKVTIQPSQSKTTADFSAITTWGVFHNEVTGKQNIILMEADKGRWDFPELKRIALEKNHYWQPEQIIIEAKATGLPLTHELQAMGIPVINFTPSRGNDKLVV
jgi:hypothetical protein